jgi:hypothetical protein
MSYLEDRQKRKNGLLPPLPTKKEKKFLNKQSEKKRAEIAAIKDSGGDNEMDLFFEAMRKKMKGHCLFCNGKTEKDNDEKFRFSIAHLLPKRPINKGGFPSVGTNENNWIELCHFGNSCHTNFDTGTITWEFIKDSKEWEVIKEKLLTVLPMVADEEKKNKLYSKLINLVYETK